MSCQDAQSDLSLSWDPINMNVGNEVQRGVCLVEAYFDLVPHGPSWEKLPAIQLSVSSHAIREVQIV